MQDNRSHQREVLHFLQCNAGTFYRVHELADALGLDYGQVRAAVDLLTYADMRICEDDDGALMYLPARV